MKVPNVKNTWQGITRSVFTPGQRARILVAPVLIITAASFLGYFLFSRSEAIMKEQLRERLRVTAAEGALNIDPNLVQDIKGKKQMNSESFKKLLKQVQDVRTQDPLILYAYVMRRTEDPNTLEFVIDADSALPPAQLDRNGNGIIDDDEVPGNPGDPYDISDPSFFPLRTEGFMRPVTDLEVTEDKWGSYISGYAPIFDVQGNAVAILGIDMDAGSFFRLARSIVSPTILLLMILSGFIVAGYLLFLWDQHNVEMLRRIDKERSGLLQLTFHQLGEPITIMEWSLETLSDNLSIEQLEKVVPEHITTMNEGLRRLNGIIDTLQFAEKIDLGSISFQLEPVVLEPVLKEVASKYKTMLEAAQQTLVITCDADIRLLADREHLKVVLSEIVGNAITYSTKNCSVDVRVHPEHRTVHIDIQDHGCGIPKADMPRLFEKYMRGANAHLHRPDGNGLGLYICKGIMDGMGGDIAVESVEDVGTKVSISLPMA